MLANGPACTIQAQRRLRHLRSIVARNISVGDQSAGDLGCYYYTLHASAIDDIDYTQVKEANQDFGAHDVEVRKDKQGLFSPRSQPKSDPTSTTTTTQNTESLDSSSNEEEGASNSNGADEAAVSSDEKSRDDDGDQSTTTATPEEAAPDVDGSPTASTDNGEPPNHRPVSRLRSGSARMSVLGANLKLYDRQKQETSVEEQLLPPFYTSEVVMNSMNPGWRHLDCSRFHLMDFVDEYDSFNVCIWNCKAIDSPPVHHSEVRMSELEFLGLELKSLTHHVFPANTLLIELKDGFYVMPEIRNLTLPARESFQKTVSTPDKRKIYMHNRPNLATLVARRRRLAVAQENSRNLSSSIETKIENNDSYVALVKKQEALRLRLNRLRQDVRDSEQAVRSEGEAVQAARQELLPRASGLLHAQVELRRTKQQVEHDRQVLEQEKERLSRTLTSLHRRRWDLIAELKLVYPIQKAVDGRTLSIAGANLPNGTFADRDDEQIATALGHVAHILHVVSLYLDIPLRYHILPMCSRTIISDEIAPLEGIPKCPLYSRGVDKKRFDYAVFLLHKNLEQLLNSQGLESQATRHFLPNVLMLLSRGGT